MPIADVEDYYDAWINSLQYLRAAVTWDRVERHVVALAQRLGDEDLPRRAPVGRG
ncbi:MAG: hypothetical protein ACRDQW_18720 [Haloechinothrix sp.]